MLIHNINLKYDHDTKLHFMADQSFTERDFHPICTLNESSPVTSDDIFQHLQDNLKKQSQTKCNKRFAGRSIDVMK